MISLMKSFSDHRSAYKCWRMALSSCAVVVTAAAMAGCGAADESGSTRDGRLNHVTLTMPVASVAFATLYLAEDTGLFTKNGLDVKLVTTGGGGPDTLALLSGDAEFNAATGAAHIQTIGKGENVVAVYDTMNQNVINLAMDKEVADERGIDESSSLEEKARALKGLTIGTTRPGALGYQTVLHFLRIADLDPDSDVKLVGVGGGAAMLAALKSGQVDVIATGIPIPGLAVRQGFAVMLLNNAKGEDPSMSPFHMNTILVRPDYLKEHRDIVKSMVRSLAQAQEMIDSKSAADLADILQRDFPDVSHELLIQTLELVKDGSQNHGVLARDAIAHTVRMMESPVPVDDVMASYDDGPLKEVEAEMR